MVSPPHCIGDGPSRKQNGPRQSTAPTPQLEADCRYTELAHLASLHSTLLQLVEHDNQELTRVVIDKLDQGQKNTIGKQALTKCLNENKLNR